MTTEGTNRTVFCSNLSIFIVYSSYQWQIDQLDMYRKFMEPPLAYIKAQTALDNASTLLQTKNCTK